MNPCAGPRRSAVIGEARGRHIAGMITTCIALLLSIFSVDAGAAPITGPILEGIKVKPAAKFSTHVETWCYGDDKCAGSPAKGVPLSQCKGEHQGVRLVVVYDVGGGVKKRGPCMAGDFFDLRDPVPPVLTPKQG